MPGYVATRHDPAARKVENPGQPLVRRTNGWMDGLAAPCGAFGKDEDTRCGVRARLPF